MPNIWEIENTNKLIFEIDNNYRELLFSLCIETLKNYDGIPLEAQDLYYEFLGEVKNVCLAYQEHLNVPFRNYLSLQCKYFCQNKCKFFSSRNHQVMNSYVLFDEKTNFVEDVQEAEKLNIIDTLDSTELQYFKLRFLDGKKDKEIQEIMNLSYYKVKLLHEQIMKKMKTKLKI